MRIARAVTIAVLLSAPGAVAGCSAEPVAGSATPAASSTTDAAPSDQFGPLGYGKLRLGMSMLDAQATGEIAQVEDMKGDPPGCGRYTTKTGASGFYKQGEIVAIMHNKLPARTPEGVAAGSTVDEVRAAYPALKLGHNWSSADVPGHPAHYGFLGVRRQSAPDAKVTQMLLYNDNDTCHN
ncbi:hypothetical protein [Nocardia bovistercoris]|uniref:DUF3558 domain-containing protein n=1 Tax=Nocardia bovistercoris TaxID=2785916 RepID=A0A931N4C8_9NOCA|nr:hypothetical protein [Nocardia bovistercoris]MBH0777488.1 hypothetical protein [Nocardia bovistercoris]